MWLTCLVGFDETTDKVSQFFPGVRRVEDIPENMLPPYITHMTECKRGVMISSLVHSMVLTARFHLRDGNCKFVMAEEAILPLIPVSSTDAGTLGKAILLTLEKRVFSVPVSRWLRQLADGGWCHFAVFMVASDFASANVKFIRQLKALILLVRLLDDSRPIAALTADAFSPSVLVWHERCGLHQLGRSVICLARTLNCSKGPKSLTKLLRLRRARDAYKSEVLKKFDESLDFQGLPVSDSRKTQRQDIVDRLVRVVCKKNVASQYPQHFIFVAKKVSPHPLVHCAFLSKSLPFDHCAVLCKTVTSVWVGSPPRACV